MRKALVTGGSRGIGRAIVDELRARGIDVATPSRKDLDLNQRESIQSWLKAHSWDYDILINNAGENNPRPLEQIPFEEWEKILSTNLTGAFLLIQAAGPVMAARGWGRIINISSIYSELSRSGRAAYSASKAALNALSRSAAVEYGSRGVLVNSVCPGFVDTELTRKNNSPETITKLESQTALGRLAQVKEIAKFVSWLTSEENSYLTGQTLFIDGGFSIQ